MVHYSFPLLVLEHSIHFDDHVDLDYINDNANYDGDDDAD